MYYCSASAPAFLTRRLDHDVETAGKMASVTVTCIPELTGIICRDLLTCSSCTPRAKAFICEISILSYCVPIMDINQLSSGVIQSEARLMHLE